MLTSGLVLAELVADWLLVDAAWPEELPRGHLKPHLPLFLLPLLSMVPGHHGTSRLRAAAPVTVLFRWKLADSHVKT